MALDANLKTVPLTANFVEKSDGTVIIEGLIADPSVALSAVHAVKDVTPVGGSAGGGSDAGGDIYFLAMYDTAGGLIKSDEVLYNNDTRTIHTPSLTAYKTDGVNVSGALNVSGNHNVIGNHSVTGTLDVTGVTNAHGVLRGNNIVSALSGLSVSGDVAVTGDATITGTMAVGQSAKAQDYVALEVTSDVGGFLPPRMTTTQRDDMTPPTGLIIFNTTDTAVQFWNGGAWRSM